MTRSTAISQARQFLFNGRFESDLRRRVAIRSVSQDPALRSELLRYHQEILQSIEPLGFAGAVYDNPHPEGGPILIAKYIEDPALPTLLCYGHGDVVPGLDHLWTAPLTPWELREDGERIYGRGTADNKGQHTMVLLALESVKAARGGRLGYNVTLLMDVGEEVGSAGLLDFCRAHQEALRADLLISSDGPRVNKDQPSVALGTRGVFNFDLICDLRASGHHSGNWGGLIANPAILLAHALADLVERNGRIAARGVLPPEVPGSVRRALQTVAIDAGPQGPQIDGWWGEPGLTPEERSFGWNALEVLTLSCGVQGKPVNAVPPRAVAHCQIRYTVDRDATEFLPALQQHLAERGHQHIEVRAAHERGEMFPTRLDPDHPAAVWVSDSIQRTLGKPAALIPNAGGSLPNDCFADLLGLPTLWVTHSYPACGQHAGNEHLLKPLVDEGLQVMAGLFWDLPDYFAARAAA